jgi:hypothetical protein
MNLAVLDQTIERLAGVVPDGVLDLVVGPLPHAALCGVMEEAKDPLAVERHLGPDLQVLPNAERRVDRLGECRIRVIRGDL